MWIDYGGWIDVDSKRCSQAGYGADFFCISFNFARFSSLAKLMPTSREDDALSARAEVRYLRSRMQRLEEKALGYMPMQERERFELGMTRWLEEVAVVEERMRERVGRH